MKSVMCDAPDCHDEAVVLIGRDASHAFCIHHAPNAAKPEAVKATRVRNAPEKIARLRDMLKKVLDFGVPYVIFTEIQKVLKETE